MNKFIQDKLRDLPGPILVLGASGFIGANLFRYMAKFRSDVYGTSSHLSPHRLRGFNSGHLCVVNLLLKNELEDLLSEVQPKTIFHCVAYGAYSFQNDTKLIYETNFNFLVELLEQLSEMSIHCFVHCGTSSEYGKQSAGPAETSPGTPNSHYAVSKTSAAGAIYHMGQEHGVPCINLRIYSAYGPYEDSSRLIPTLIKNVSEGSLPNFVDAQISRDFVYIEDIVEAFILSASSLTPAYFGQSFNIGTGTCTKIGELAELAKQLFEISENPRFSMSQRDWDDSSHEWFANPKLAKEVFGWQAQTDFSNGLLKTKQWYNELEADYKEIYLTSSKQNIDKYFTHSVSAIIACYRDAQAIPIMYERLCKILDKLNVDFEIIFVNDASPDESEEIILELSSKDNRVLGISHSRNFGSQSAFRSGMEMASKKSIVLLDGDLQDPPELIEDFVKKWEEGYEIVYGRRIKRKASWFMQVSYKLFYRLFDRFSYIAIPHDAGDFSLLDEKVVKHLLQFPERDIFLRGLRAFVGFRQIGVDYVRPERMFGKTTNSLFRNLSWAKKGIFSFSYAPLNILTTFSCILFFLTLVVSIYQIVAILLFPESSPEGITTVLLVNFGFGSLILLAVSLVGEYIARIFEEVKRRPRYIRRSIIQNGHVQEL